MNFKNFIKHYSQTVNHIKVLGFHNPDNGGKYERVTEKNEIKGAVMPLTREELNYDEGGTWNSEDRKLFTYNTLKKGDKIEYREEEYTIQQRLDFSDYDKGLNVYFIRRSDDG